MSAWDCCRTCLATASLSPIFSQTEYSEHYTNVIFIATGVKVEPNDSLPQLICHPCITTINNSMKFRKKCELSQSTLRNRLNDYTHGIKLEPNKTDLTIDISDYIDDDFKDFDDNITLNTLQYESEKEDTKDIYPEPEKDMKDIYTEPEKDMKDIYTEPEKDTKKHYENKVQESKEGIFKKVKKEKVVRKRSKKKETNGEKTKEQIECEYCHKILTSKLSIRNHYKIHTGFDVVCEHCGKKFITRRLLLMHCRAKHGYEKTDKCSYCDYRASNAEQVKIHERLHTGEKPYVCAQCGAGFHRKSSYLQHVAIHLPEKTVQCTVCPARFKSVTLMRIHAARHRAPRYTFQCALCDNSFARRRNVARHVLRIHGTPPEPHTICRRKIA